MKAIGSLLAVLLFLGSIGLLIWGSIQGIGFLINQFGTLDSELTSVIIIISTLILLCSLILAAAIRFNKTKNDKQVHPEKAYIYSEFITYYVELRKSIQTEGKINYRFRSDISLWSGKEVLKSYIKFNRLLDELNPDNPIILEQAEKVLFEMRKELGNDNFGLRTGDLDNIIYEPSGKKAASINQQRQSS